MSFIMGVSTVRQVWASVLCYAGLVKTSPSHGLINALAWLSALIHLWLLRRNSLRLLLMVSTAALLLQVMWRAAARRAPVRVWALAHRKVRVCKVQDDRKQGQGGKGG